jgi:hypothetical protein
MADDTPTLAAVGHLRGNGQWFAGEVLTNPADGTLLADTGAIIPPGEYLFSVHGTCSVAWVYDVQYRDATNATTNTSPSGFPCFQRRRLAAGTEDFIFPNKLSSILLNERVRVVLVGTIVGEVQMSIFMQRVG